MDPVVDMALRTALALLFAVAARHKLGDLAEFRATFADYRVVPAAFVPLGATLVVAIEVATAGLLLVPAWRRAGLLAAAALLGTYAVAIAVNLARGRHHIDCGCTGPVGKQPISGWLVGRNLLLASAALAVSGAPSGRPLVWIDVVTIAGTVMGLVALYAAADRLVANRPGLARARGVA